VVYVVLAVWALLLIGLLVRGIHVIQPYQQGVVVLLGAYKRLLQPGFNWVTPVASVRRVDLRSQRLVVQAPWSAPLGSTAQAGIVITYRIVDAPAALFQTQDLRGDLATRARKAAVELMGSGHDLTTPGEQLQFGAQLAEQIAPEAKRMGVAVEMVTLEPSPSPGAP